MRFIWRFKTKYNRSRRGFTLIELLLYMGIFSIFLIVTLEMFSSIFDIQLESEATSSVSTDGRFILQRFTYDVNRATNISEPILYGTTNATLILEVDGQNLIYSLDSGNLILENETIGTLDQLNTSESSVSNLSFIKLNGGDFDTVQINFTLTSETRRKGGQEVKEFQTSAGLR